MGNEGTNLAAAKVSSTINDRLAYWVDNNPDQLLFAFLDRKGNFQDKYTYREFSDRVELVASQLAARNDLEPGSRALLLYPAGLEMICALFACAKAGIIAVPAPPPSSFGFSGTLARLEHMIKDSGATAILMNNESEFILKDAMAAPENASENEKLVYGLNWINSETFETSIANIKHPATSEIVFLQYTSGSTNQPKGVMVCHDNLLHNCDLVIEHEKPISVTWLPQHHDMGLIGYYIYMALCGGTTYGFSPTTFIQNPALWLETISKYKATATSAPNFAFDLCVEDRRFSNKVLENIDLSSLRVLMAAAEPIKAETYENFLRKYEPYGLKKDSFFVAYGLAEFTIAVSFYGRRYLSLHKGELAEGNVQPIVSASQVSERVQVMSCGTLLGDNRVCIIDPDTGKIAANDRVGEIWLSGRSKCLGYWNRPEVSKEIFDAAIPSTPTFGDSFLRTGDMGFMYEGELFVCGRQKDMIILRGKNYFPQDIETVVENNFPQLRKGFLAAFEVEDNGEAGAALIAEVNRRTTPPEPHSVIKCVLEQLDLPLSRVVFVPPKTIVKTSSGKTRRFKMRQLLEDDQLPILEEHVFKCANDDGFDEDGQSGLAKLKHRYNLTGEEEFTLLDAGIDSFDLVVFLHWLQEEVADRGSHLLSDKIDAKLLGALSIRELFQMAALLENANEETLLDVRNIVLSRYDENIANEQAAMKADSKLSFEPIAPVYDHTDSIAKNVLLTGGTGFLGPFILAALLEQTSAQITLLTRAKNDTLALDRIASGLKTCGWNDEKIEANRTRMKVVCGDLEAPQMGLNKAQWELLTAEIDTIYHNGALVNYLLDYERMKPANVIGTEEILKFAFAGRAKHFNHISTTFIFGWAVKDRLLESDRNENMEHLDFGYSQSKWVSEQLVQDAISKGLSARIFRPALITPSIHGGGENFDITIRLLLFMIKHGIGASAKNQVSFMPADVTADNIVSIANQPDSVGGFYHVVRDEYECLNDITDLITAKTGREFEKFSTTEFVPEIVRRCSKDDLLFPLIDFLIGSADRISAMEFKLYDSSQYKAFRDQGAGSQEDPPLEFIVDGILNFLRRQKLI